MANEKLSFWRTLAVTAVVALILDQATKLWVVSTVGTYETKRLIGNFLWVTLTYNNRGIFGLPFGSPITYYILPLVGIAFVIFFAIRSTGVLYSLSFGLILAGAVGNVLDRIRIGKVIDFINMGISRSVRWYIYNLADLFLIAGIVLLLVREVKKDAKKEKPDEKDLP
jgi:signal peptidase II